MLPSLYRSGVQPKDGTVSHAVSCSPGFLDRAMFGSPVSDGSSSLDGDEESIV